ncbi:uncharacterized protein BKA78DRAFT_358329 [Phyllosticta capitalensis]|uniref:uncharacterized protein n=1 Tax=Phyllosticta capitalensis TaxID=121624 RepID=UPI00312DEB15
MNDQIKIIWTGAKADEGREARRSGTAFSMRLPLSFDLIKDALCEFDSPERVAQQQLVNEAMINQAAVMAWRKRILGVRIDFAYFAFIAYEKAVNDALWILWLMRPLRPIPELIRGIVKTMALPGEALDSSVVSNCLQPIRYRLQEIVDKSDNFEREISRKIRVMFPADDIGRLLSAVRATIECILPQRLARDKCLADMLQDLLKVMDKMEIPQDSLDIAFPCVLYAKLATEKAVRKLKACACVLVEIRSKLAPDAAICEVCQIFDNVADNDTARKIVDGIHNKGIEHTKVKVAFAQKKLTHFVGRLDHINQHNAFPSHDARSTVRAAINSIIDVKDEVKKMDEKQKGEVGNVLLGVLSDTVRGRLQDVAGLSTVKTALEDASTSSANQIHTIAGDVLQILGELLDMEG